MMADCVVKFELENKDGGDLTSFTAGAHIDLVIDAPFTRQYSLAGNPADRKKYVLGHIFSCLQDYRQDCIGG